jgi:ABC-2 type transport system permease protein
MLVFMAAMTIAREVEASTLRRLIITRMSAFDLLGGITLALMGLAVMQVLLTILAAYALGFRSQGPLWLAIGVSVLTSLSVIGVGLLVASFVRTVNQAFVIANFPLGFMMFFSGSIFPIPRAVLFTLGGHAFSPYDILPATHAVIALNKVMTLGLGLKEIGFELAALTILSVVYFGAGVWLFHNKHMR